MKEQLQDFLTKRILQCVGKTNEIYCEKIERKKEAFAKNNRNIVKVKATGKIININEIEDEKDVLYTVYFQYFIDHDGNLYIEEELEQRQAIFLKNEKIADKELSEFQKQTELDEPAEEVSSLVYNETEEARKFFQYDRLQAVKYAERWWNENNPAYVSFEDNCTNYISQCLRAGGAPMIGYPNRSRGWWMGKGNWSYSWTVAHSLTNYLLKASAGVRAKAVSDPQELDLGDIICYDFQGDGRFDHTTIVTSKDKNGFPLVNANTANSRQRFWDYEDSTAYTPNIKYKFLQIVDDQT